MLPYPATAPSPPKRPRHSGTSSLGKLASLPHINALGLVSSNANVHARGYRRRLFARSPLTNAGALILAAMLGVSLLVNIGYWMGGPGDAGRRRVSVHEDGGWWLDGAGTVLGEGGAEEAKGGGVKVEPVLDETTPATLPPIRTPSELETLHSVTRPDWARQLDHLIIVPGHAIWKGSNPQLRMSESEWVLEPYQRGGGRIRAFFSHIVRGAELALKDPHALLVFSGGQTRSSSSLTEADSYLRLALASNVFHNHDESASLEDAPPFARATTEAYALDSFQNLLFSVARFYEVTGRHPNKITIVGYEMKRRRFVELHRKAIRWPASSFEYVGVDLGTGEDDAEREVAMKGEIQNAYTPYTLDLYGCHAPLATKRLGRNPFVRFHPYLGSSDGALRGLLEWCPREDWTGVYAGALPWDGD